MQTDPCLVGKHTSDEGESFEPRYASVGVGPHGRIATSKMPGLFVAKLQAMRTRSNYCEPGIFGHEKKEEGLGYRIILGAQRSVGV